MGRIFYPLLALLASATRQELARQVAYPLSPNLRAHVERFIQTLQVECLDKFVIVAQRHLNHVCRQFEAWYNTERPHEACGHLPPAMEAEPEERTTIRRGDVVCNMRLGGALKSYSRRAA